ETPVAFSNILPAKLEEELAGRDIPMILNSTPGVYATQQGGGEGDARITIRGFNQRNVAVMLDGVPVNDMENGWVYWSNWVGLDMITRTIQVQRGLGASRLGIPSVGGTMNIMTQGISSKPGGSIKQEITDYGNYRTSFGLTTGKLGNWGITLAGSYKWGGGYVDATDNKGYFYYLKIERRLGKHLLSLTGFGAPQQHSQRSYKTSIALIDSAYAIDVAGVPDSLASNPLYWPKFTNLGIRYNQHWGYLNRWTINSNGDTIWAGEEKLNEKLNYYHKPQFSLKDTWTVNDKLFISNNLYLSIGNGGGTGLYTSPRIGTRTTPLIDFQKIYDYNARALNYDAQNGGRKSSNFIYSSVNNHFWYGLLSSAEYQINENYNLSGGIDLRSYTGEHYREVYDLLGGDFVIMGDNSPLNGVPYSKRKHVVGDKIAYHNDGNVRWSGLFGQLEYSNPNYSWFVSGSVSRVDYRRVDYFAPYYYNDTLVQFRSIRFGPNANPEIYFPYINRGSQIYYIDLNDAVQKNKYSPWKKYYGYTIKAGFNYNITEKINAFINAGNLSRAPRFNNVFANNTNNTPKNLKNEEVYAVEIGSTFSSPMFSCNLNGYFTYWNNKPLDNLPSIVDPNTDERFYLNITGIAARHAGIEFDCVYKPIKKLELQGLVSLGDWVYNSADSVVYINETTGQTLGTPIVYDAKGVHVGDAAQTQLGGSVRYDIIKGLFVQLRGTYFNRYYADFEPSTLNGNNKRRESWILPSYTLFDFTAGYNIKITQKQTASFSFNVLNVFDKIYISDAKNNSTNLEYQNLNNFDAHSAEVFFGMGRRINLSMKINF
ncbi:MAG TPA: TonB-dependent receptor, partial [Salinivirgaceae bacterium]|nr:TonB-dependent receptor [Salinivirgaceae bacterium]